MKRLQLFITLTLSALIIGFLGFYEPGQENLTPTAATAERQIDSFMVDAVSTQYDIQGQPEQKLNARRVTHFADTEHSVLEQPDLLLYRDQRPPVRIEADEGEVSANNDEVWLRDNVSIVEQQAGGLKMLTDYLRLEPDREYAETDRPVTLLSPNGKKDAIGMQAYLAEDRVLLLNDVRGYHEPRR